MNTNKSDYKAVRLRCNTISHQVLVMTSSVHSIHQTKHSVLHRGSKWKKKERTEFERSTKTKGKGLQKVHVQWRSESQTGWER